MKDKLYKLFLLVYCIPCVMLILIILGIEMPSEWDATVTCWLLIQTLLFPIIKLIKSL